MTQSNNTIHIDPLDGAVELYKEGITFHHSFIIRNPDRTIYGYGYILSDHKSYEKAKNLNWINLEFSPKTIYQINLKTKAQMKRDCNTIQTTDTINGEKYNKNTVLKPALSGTRPDLLMTDDFLTGKYHSYLINDIKEESKK